MDINQEIKKRIRKKFPTLKITIVHDKTQDNIIVATNSDSYYDDKYLELIMDIKMNLLWKNNIFNYLFVQETPELPVGSVLKTAGKKKPPSSRKRKKTSSGTSSRDAGRIYASGSGGEPRL